MQRIIHIEVAGNRARASSRELGTQGEVAAVTVALAFDAGWDGLAKRLLWRSAGGSSTGYTLLTEPDAAGVYAAAVPALPLSEAGKASLTVEGVVVSGQEVVRRVRSVLLTFRVEPNDLEANSPAQAVDATVAEQLASAIEGRAAASHTHTKSDVTDFAHAHAQSDITGLASALSGKAAASHTHTKSDVTDFAHTHTKSEITDFAHTHAVDAADVTYTKSGVSVGVKAALDAVLDYAGSSRVKDYSVTLSANGWDDYETPYTQSISHPMINADSAVLVAVASSATDAQFEAACAACLRFDSLAGALYARAYGTLPEVDIPLKIGVIV
ncbi:MAG: hypothetical protein IJL83_06100 [Clostridia bacterium]|nr:hypothetical protein [Clostridia bacterium]